MATVISVMSSRTARDRGGLRYCINSASLRFVARADMAEQGYGAFLDQIAVSPAATERAVLAGGCFWGMRDLIRKLPGVISTRVGYTCHFVRPNSKLPHRAPVA